MQPRCHFFFLRNADQSITLKTNIRNEPSTSPNAVSKLTWDFDHMNVDLLTRHPHAHRHSTLKSFDPSPELLLKAGTETCSSTRGTSSTNTSSRSRLRSRHFSTLRCVCAAISFKPTVRILVTHMASWSVC